MDDSIDQQGVARACALLANAHGVVVLTGARISAEAAVARGARFTFVTRNVDGLHHAAGIRLIHELQGNIRRARCVDGGHPAKSWDEAGAMLPLSQS